MNVVLVGAEFEENLAVRYLRGALESAGHTVRQVVFNAASDQERAAEEIARSGAALVGLSMVFTLRAWEFAALATRARALGYRGHVVAGGHFAAFHATELLTDVPAIDSVAIGEGEALLCRLCERLDDLAAVPGLVWRRGGRIVRNAASLVRVELDALAWPPRKQPFDEYLGLPISNLLGSRGCMWACSFCSIVAWHKLGTGPRVRLRDPERLADEMADLHARGVRIFNFHDDNFFLQKPEQTRARVEALAAALRRRGVGERARIAFAVKCRPGSVDEELLRALQELGLFRLFLGIEAGTAASLEQLGRRQTVADNERALEVVNRLDLHTCFNLLLFNPWSSLEDVAGNVAFLRRHPHNPTNFCRTEIYSGTPLERRLRQEGRLLGDYWGWDYVMLDPRAQAAFEVVYPAFRTRNYGARGLHHLGMLLDYEQQLLGHFFGSRPALRQRTKALVAEINLDTCEHLEWVLARIAAGVANERARALLTRELTHRVSAADRRLRARADHGLAEIRRAARSPEARRRGGLGTVATVAASLALAACSRCDEPDTHMTETIAAPPHPTGTHTTETVAAPPRPAEPPTPTDQPGGEPEPAPGEPAPTAPPGRERAPIPSHVSETVARPPPRRPRPPRPRRPDRPRPSHPSEMIPEKGGRRR